MEIRFISVLLSSVYYHCVCGLSARILNGAFMTPQVQHVLHNLQTQTQEPFVHVLFSTWCTHEYINLKLECCKHHIKSLKRNHFLLTLRVPDTPKSPQLQNPRASDFMRAQPPVIYRVKGKGETPMPSIMGIQLSKFSETLMNLAVTEIH